MRVQLVIKDCSETVVINDVKQWIIVDNVLCLFIKDETSYHFNMNFVISYAILKGE